MKTRHATLIRKGILAARDSERAQYVHLAPRLVREAARREAKNISRRAELEEDREFRALLHPTGDLATDIANRAIFAGITGSIPQRVMLGIDPLFHLRPGRPYRPAGILQPYFDDMNRLLFPKPIPDTFKAAPEPPKQFTVPAWHKHHSEPTPYAPISDAVARKARPEQAEHLRRFYA